ncbi:hypothetical protein G9F72_011830 [Clostridium estertheticum]|uniref:hypothetical protein n=1 Tax=Clostridium estertheticum TaxID=238834 RepID=UPI0013E95411|nr:hypothetical protein [Clostridium estertheticum]MBZ9687014.1 hypothetical protein [Clostridium estertheticum]
MENNNQIQVRDVNDQPMALGDWIITFLLLSIPVVNIVLLFVWALGKDVNKSKKTYCQAELIVLAFVLVLYLAFFGAFFASMMNGLNSFNL